MPVNKPGSTKLTRCSENTESATNSHHGGKNKGTAARRNALTLANAEFQSFMLKFEQVFNIYSARLSASGKDPFWIRFARDCTIFQYRDVGVSMRDFSPRQVTP